MTKCMEWAASAKFGMNPHKKDRMKKGLPDIDTSKAKPFTRM